MIKLRKIKCDVVVVGGARWLDGIKKSKIFDMPKSKILARRKTLREVWVEYGVGGERRKIKHDFTKWDKSKI